MRDTLRLLAVPRLHGTPAADRVAAEIRSQLEGSGCRVTNLAFGFSAWPLQRGLPIAGLLLAAAFAGAALLLRQGHAALAALVLLLLAVLALAIMLAMDGVILRCPFMRRTGVNFLAAPADASPRFLVMAHRDSKSQGVPLVLRLGAVISVLLAWCGLILEAGASLVMGGQDGAPAAVTVSAAGSGALTLLVTLLGAAGALGALILARCSAGNESAGALDNASGVTALLRVAAQEQERGSRDVAYLVTDAEEFCLAGSRAAATGMAGLAAVINIDGIDDHGRFFVLTDGSARPHSVDMVALLGGVAAAAGESLRHRRVPPGLLLDHSPFARQGVAACTLMRGNFGSLARVHWPADAAQRMTGEGSVAAARLVSLALQRLREAAANTVADTALSRPG